MHPILVFVPKKLKAKLAEKELRTKISEKGGISGYIRELVKKRIEKDDIPQNTLIRVYLDYDTANRLPRIAHRKRTSVAQIIRNILIEDLLGEDQ